MAKSRGKKRRKNARGAAREAAAPRIAATPPASSRRRALSAASLVLVLATLGAYWRVQEQGFIELDDQKYVEENAEVQQGLSSDGVVWAFTTQHASNWHPLTWLSHMLDCELFGVDPGAHHLTNLLLHIGSALLLLAVMMRLTGAPWASLLVAGLFALHPLHVESVAWLSERKDVLSTLLWMLTMWVYLRYVERPGRAGQIALVLVFALGLLAKPMLVTLPFVLLLLDYWPLGRIGAGQSLPAVHQDQRDSRQRTISALLIEKAPLFLLAALSSWMTVRAQRAGGAAAPLELISLGERVSNALCSYAVYIWKTVWPLDLAVFYPHPGRPPAGQLTVAALLLVALTALAWRTRTKRPYLAVGWLWYLGTLVPVIGLVQVGEQAIADRYTYIPTIGLFLMVAVGIAELLAGRRHLVMVATGAAILVLAALGVRTWHQVGYWENSITLFQRSVAVTKNNYKLNNTLGGLYLDRGDLPTARRHLEASLSQLPGYADAHVNLGLLELRSGDMQAAIDNYRKALAGDPDNAQGHDNLGSALATTGRVEEALTHFRQALRLDPTRARTHHNLATALVQSGRPEEAVAGFETAIELDPGYANAHASLADLLAQLGRPDEAVARFETAVALDPQHLQAHFNLGRLLAQLDRLEAAKRHFEAVIRIEPTLPEPHFYLGLAHLYGGDERRALEQHRILARLNPQMADHLLRTIRSGG